MKEKPKMYVVRKYVRAMNVQSALRKEGKTPVHEIFVDDKWSEKELASAIGFESDTPTEE